MGLSGQAARAGNAKAATPVATHCKAERREKAKFCMANSLNSVNVCANVRRTGRYANRLPLILAISEAPDNEPESTKVVRTKSLTL